MNLTPPLILTPIQSQYFCSRYGDVDASWRTLGRAATPAEQYCIALTAFFGGVRGMDHSNEFAANLLIESADRGYLPACGALRVNFDWFVQQQLPAKVSLIDADAVGRLMACDMHIDLESAYWVAKMHDLGDGVRKNAKLGREIKRQIAVAARPSYCREFGESLERQKDRRSQLLSAHYLYYAAQLGDRIAALHIGRDLSTGSTRFPYEPTLAQFWLKQAT